MTAKKNLNALVTGANGFLGQHLCHQLVAQGWRVYALCRSHEKAKVLSSEIHTVIGDILSTEQFERHLPKNLGAVFHTAASTNTWFKKNALQTKTNLVGTQNMLDLAVKHKVKKFIHISSVVVYGIHKELKNITEDMPKTGINSWINYVLTKSQSEQLVLKTKNLETIIVNPTHIIGPGDKHNWARLFQMIAKQNLPSIPNGAGSFVDVRDVATGIVAAFYFGKDKENYLLAGTDLDFKTFVNKVADKLDVKITSLQLSNSLLLLLAKTKNLISRLTNKEPDLTPESVTLISDLYQCDAKKARAEIKYSNRNLNETLDDTLNFLKNENMI